MPIQNKDTLAASVPTPPLGSTTLFTDAGLLRTKDDTGTVITLAAGGTVTGVSVTTANGVSGVVATPTTTPAITLTLGAITPSSVAATSFISANGDLTINGLGRRITADFTNATVANRTLIQTSTVNGHTHTGTIPNGTGSLSSINAFDASDPDNASWVSMFSGGSISGIQSGKSGIGVFHPFYILVGTGAITAMQFDPLGNSIFGGAALATNATDRFPYLPTMAGTPIGIPTTVAGKSPVVVDTTNNKLYFYSTGAWRDSTTGGTVTTVSVTTANGVSGSVATASTTPAITLTLGAITPTSVSSTGDVSVETAGNGLKIKEGSNAKMGTATLVLGTLVVSTTAVTANSRIFLTAQSLGNITVPAALAVSARTAATSFTILSSDLTDTSVVGWMIVEPA